MKTRFKTNPFFILNAGVVGFLSLGASYFTIIPILLWEIDFERMISSVTQNHAMIDIWMIYFTSIAFLPMTLKKDKKRNVIFVIFVIGIVIFALFITGVFSCWQSEMFRFFGLEYNDRLRC